MSSIECLPDIILDHIFWFLRPLELLRSCALVSKRWNTLVVRRALVVRGTRHLQRVRHSLHALYVLLPDIISEMPPRVPLFDLVPTIVRQAPLLVELSLGVDVPLDPYMMGTLNGLRCLRHLDVFPSYKIGSETLPLLLRLDALVLNNVVHSKVLVELATQGRLKALHLQGYLLVRNYPLRGMLRLINATDLRELTLRCSELHNPAYETVVTCPNLTSLQLYSCRYLTGAGAVHLTRPRGLTRLHVTGARSLSPVGLAAMLATLPPGLKDLALSGTSFADEHAQLVITHAPHLEELELWRVHISAKAVILLASLLLQIRCLSVEVAMTAEQLRILAVHPTLKLVRCGSMPMKPDTYKISGLRVVSTKAKYPLPCMFQSNLDNSTDGFRASFCYYWMHYSDLEPVGATANMAISTVMEDSHNNMFAKLPIPGATYVTNTISIDGVYREYYRNYSYDVDNEVVGTRPSRFTVKYSHC
ncbi:unnamed protein product [Spodoptera littoralis]|uniref:F-box domain-containing protein n=2 Tax=Spodoptera TaxID=7106 RepID=A0A9N8KX64_SPOLI|nr:uncharacterized protein LOC111360129 [Spodoptera litura]CAB3511239.1 unnamed protein product [Spodoptera littoralis]CAD0233599.1 unnamed protein product [Spodoptera littoralis]